MELTHEQRLIGIKYNILSLLTEDIKNNRYNELQQLYDVLNFKNNEKLVAKLSEERTIAESFTRSIYRDILYVIADYINTRPEISDMVDVLYAKRCPKIKKVFIDWENQYKSTKTVVGKNFKMSLIENFYLRFLLYRSDIITEQNKILKNFDFEEDRYQLNFRFLMSDKNQFDNALIFCTEADELNKYIQGDRGEKELVLSSKFFDRYLIKRKKELADYLNIKEDDLGNYIHNEMKSHSLNGGSPLRTGLVGQTENFTKDIISNHNGGTVWYNVMTTDDNEMIFEQPIKYIPNVEGIIESYFKSFVSAKYAEIVIENKSEFTRLTLARECIPQNYEVVYQAILCMYEMDVLYKMFTIMQRQYYIDFSWEKITNQDLTARYESIISNLEKTITEKENKIKNLSQKNTTLSLQINTENSKHTAPLVAENNKLIKIIENKNDEIAELKAKLECQEQFISELNKPVIEIKDNTYDLGTLQNKRFLFVGHIGEALPELKHKFPNSIFMESETASLSGVEVDAIVMLIKWMSHSMFYKIKSSALAQAKTIMCNTKNIETILQKMYDEII